MTKDSISEVFTSNTVGCFLVQYSVNNSLFRVLLTRSACSPTALCLVSYLKGNGKGELQEHGLSGLQRTTSFFLGLLGLTNRGELQGTPVSAVLYLSKHSRIQDTSAPVDHHAASQASRTAISRGTVAAFPCPILQEHNMYPLLCLAAK